MVRRQQPLLLLMTTSVTPRKYLGAGEVSSPSGGAHRALGPGLLRPSVAHDVVY